MGKVFSSFSRASTVAGGNQGCGFEMNKSQRAQFSHSVSADHQVPNGYQVAYFAGGCFWGIEHTFQLAPGVLTADSGYQQGRMENPTYRTICEGDTGHAETVRVIFDPSRISFRQLLHGFFLMHDPTQVNRQGPDYGTQYRSGVWCINEEQLIIAKEFLTEH